MSNPIQQSSIPRKKQIRPSKTPTISMPDLSHSFANINAQEAESLGVSAAWKAAVIESKAIDSISAEVAEPKPAFRVVAADASLEIESEETRRVESSKSALNSEPESETEHDELDAPMAIPFSSAQSDNVVPQTSTTVGENEETAKTGFLFRTRSVVGALTNRVKNLFKNGTFRSVAYYASILVAALFVISILENSDSDKVVENSNISELIPGDKTIDPIHSEPLQESTASVEEIDDPKPEESPSVHLPNVGQYGQSQVESIVRSTDIVTETNPLPQATEQESASSDVAQTADRSTDQQNSIQGYSEFQDYPLTRGSENRSMAIHASPVDSRDATRRFDESNSNHLVNAQNLRLENRVDKGTDIDQPIDNRRHVANKNRIVDGNNQESPFFDGRGLGPEQQTALPYEETNPNTFLYPVDAVSNAINLLRNRLRR